VKVDGSKVRIALAAAIIGVLLGAYIGFSASPSTTQFIGGGIYPGAPSYTIWKEGSNYFAKNSNGEIEFSGTNATQVIQNCVSDGVSLLIKGNIILDGQIYLTDNMDVDLTNAEIKQGRTTGAYASLFVCESVANVHIHGGVLDGNRRGGVTVGHGIYIGNSKNITVEDVRIYNTWGTGIVLINATCCFVHHNYIADTGLTYGPGIRLDGYTNRSIVSENIIVDSNEHGIKEYQYGICQENQIIHNIIINPNSTGISAGGYHTLIAFNKIYNVPNNHGLYATGYYQRVIGNEVYNVTGSGNYGIKVTSNTVVSNNIVTNCFDGIQVESNCTVTGNLVYDVDYYALHIVGNCSSVTGNTCYASNTGIRVQNSYYNTILGNTLTDNYYGLYELNSDYNIITSCNSRGSTNGIITVGANTKVNLCWNGTSWIS